MYRLCLHRAPLPPLKLRGPSLGARSHSAELRSGRMTGFHAETKKVQAATC